MPRIICMFFWDTPSFDVFTKISLASLGEKRASKSLVPPGLFIDTLVFSVLYVCYKQKQHC